MVLASWKLVNRLMVASMNCKESHACKKDCTLILELRAECIGPLGRRIPTFRLIGDIDIADSARLFDLNRQQYLFDRICLRLTPYGQSVAIGVFRRCCLLHMEVVVKLSPRGPS